MEKIYTVTFTHYGFVQVEAESELDAYRKVEGYGKEDISWSDDFEVTDAKEEEKTNMNDKTYLQHRTEYLLQKAIESEIERMKNSMNHNANAVVSHCCTEIGILVALKNQAKYLIEKF